MKKKVNTNSVNTKNTTEKNICEQKCNDEVLTQLLFECISQYKIKLKSDHWYRLIIFAFCIIIIVAFSVIFGYIILNKISCNDTDGVQNAVALITVCTTFLVLVFGVLQTITKQVFLENGDPFITKLLELFKKDC